MPDNKINQDILSRGNIYLNKTKEEIEKDLNISKTGNLSQLSHKILNLNVKERDYLKRNHIEVRTTTFQRNKNKDNDKEIGIEIVPRSKESFKISQINADKLIKEQWENSELYTILSRTTYLVFIYMEDSEGEITLYHVIYWKISNEDIQENIKYTWKETQQVFKDGVSLKYENNMVLNNLPKMAHNRILHVRPSASKSSYTNNSNAMKLPYKSHWINKPDNDNYQDNYMTKQAWWLNSSYVFEEVYKIINAQHLDKNLNYIINKKIDYIFQKNNLLKNNNLINNLNDCLEKIIEEVNSQGYY